MSIQEFAAMINIGGADDPIYSKYLAAEVCERMSDQAFNGLMEELVRLKRMDTPTSGRTVHRRCLRYFTVKIKRAFHHFKNSF